MIAAALVGEALRHDTTFLAVSWRPARRSMWGTIPCPRGTRGKFPGSPRKTVDRTGGEISKHLGRPAPLRCGTHVQEFIPAASNHVSRNKDAKKTGDDSERDAFFPSPPVPHLIAHAWRIATPAVYNRSESVIALPFRVRNEMNVSTGKAP